MKKLITSVCALVCMVASLCAQNVTVQSALGQSPATFLQDNLLKGGGVYIFNVKYQNSLSSIKHEGIGTFNANGYDGLEMSEGIIMTTGNISVAEGPNNVGSASASLEPYYTDPVATQLLPAGSDPLTSCSVVDFDFVCLSGSVSFNYCFGSEEYNEFVCSSFNDIFAFVLTGPDPETGEEVTSNIARIPGTVSDDNPNGIAVSVNSVNIGDSSDLLGSQSKTGCYIDYSAYFVNNDYNYQTGPIDGVQYDGFTSKLTARANILPCQVYHMHITICNQSDQAYDSGVFIEGGSFNTPSDDTGLSRATVDTVYGSCPLVNSIDLTQASFDYAETFIATGGTAVRGVDYQIYDSRGLVIGADDSLVLTKEPTNFSIRGLQGANLSTAKTIELYLTTEFCSDFPQLTVSDTQRFVLVRGGDVKLHDTTINCTKACLEVKAPLVYGTNVSYEWQNLDGTVATGIDNPYAGTSTAMIFESHDYRVIATGGTGCNSDTALVKVVVNSKDIPVAIDEVEGSAVSVYPNPATDVINIEAEGLQRVEIFTVEGRLVLDRQYSNANGTISIPTDELENGVYGIRVSTASGKSGAKVVVKK